MSGQKEILDLLETQNKWMAAKEISFHVGGSIASCHKRLRSLRRSREIETLERDRLYYRATEEPC